MESNITTNALDVSDQFASSQGFDSVIGGGAKGGDIGFLNVPDTTFLCKQTKSIDHYGKDS